MGTSERCMRRSALRKHGFRRGSTEFGSSDILMTLIDRFATPRSLHSRALSRTDKTSGFIGRSFYSNWMGLSLQVAFGRSQRFAAVPGLLCGRSYSQIQSFPTLTFNLSQPPA